MPHLCVETYITQYFWLIIILTGFYYIMVTSVIPAISATIKLRKKLTVSEQEAEVGKEIEEIGQQKWGAKISINHTLYTPEDKKSLYFSNKNWISRKI